MAAPAAIGQITLVEAKIRCITELFAFRAEANGPFADASKYKCKSRLFGKFFVARVAPAHLCTLFIKLEFILRKKRNNLINVRSASGAKAGRDAP